MGENPACRGGIAGRAGQLAGGQPLQPRRASLGSLFSSRFAMASELPLDLVRRYDQPGPRYTSYPTAPHFSQDVGAAAYLEAAGRAEGDLSLYVHLPFCRSLCYYCACHMLVTHRPEKVAAYLDVLHREVDLVAARVRPGQRVVQVHWGGGTPTYLAPEQIEGLMAHLRARFDVAPGAEVGLEADPRGLTPEHLAAARRAGFNRLSFGVQDLDARVQEAINRVQPFELVREAVAEARRVGFESISLDLVYGLPHQTPASFRETVEQVLRLAPDRLSLFSYAHVPWKKKHQMLIQEAWLPAPEAKLALLLGAMAQLGEAGYGYLGMDHFARPGDPLYEAAQAGTMQRNFQGYSTHAGSTLLGFGLSAISQLEGLYAQNALDLPAYEAAVRAGRPPTARGVRLTADDRLRRDVVMAIMCRFAVDAAAIERRSGVVFADYFADALAQLAPMEGDGLVEVTAAGLRVTPRGRFFVRNVAMAFDAYLKRPAAAPARYSRTV